MTMPLPKGLIFSRLVMRGEDFYSQFKLHSKKKSQLRGFIRWGSFLMRTWGGSRMWALSWDPTISWGPRNGNKGRTLAQTNSTRDSRARTLWQAPAWSSLRDTSQLERTPAIQELVQDLKGLETQISWSIGKQYRIPGDLLVGHQEMQQYSHQDSHSYVTELAKAHRSITKEHRACTYITIVLIQGKKHIMRNQNLYGTSFINTIVQIFRRKC